MTTTGAPIVGDRLDVVGVICTGLRVQGFVHRGTPVTGADLLYLEFAAIWYRLGLDSGVVFWRRMDEAPVSWSVEEEGYSYPVAELARAATVVGQMVVDWCHSTTASGAQIAFAFSNGCRLIVEDIDDKTVIRIAPH